MKQRLNKAFTLTELLVTVLIIGVLAAVAFPKFTRVIETRKTSEAEKILTAIRMEQEKRCSLDKPYAGHFDKLGDLVAAAEKTPQAQTAHYIYRLQEKGVIAQSSEKDYMLSIPSYADGRLCCSGVYCQSLNKDYPLCDQMSGIKTAPCAAPVCEVARECSPGDAENKSCECGVLTRTCNTSCQWGAYTGACWSPSGARTETKDCSQIQSNLRGTATRYCTATCSGVPSCPAWSVTGCTACLAPSGEPTVQNCPEGYTGTQTRTWNASACAWNAWQGLCAPKGKWALSGMEEQLCRCDANCRNVSNAVGPVSNITAGSACTSVGSVTYVASSDRRCYCVRDGLNMGRCTISHPEVTYYQYTCR